MVETLLALARLNRVGRSFSADAAHSLTLGYRRVSDVWLINSGADGHAVGMPQQHE
jgi:hypothetical protein